MYTYTYWFSYNGTGRRWRRQRCDPRSDRARASYEIKCVTLLALMTKYKPYTSNPKCQPIKHNLGRIDTYASMLATRMQQLFCVFCVVPPLVPLLHLCLHGPLYSQRAQAQACCASSRVGCWWPPAVEAGTLHRDLIHSVALSWGHSSIQ